MRHNPRMRPWLATALLVAALPGAIPRAGAQPAAAAGPPQTVGTEFFWRTYRHFSSSDGLSNLSILSLAQGRDGFVYAGTEVGLSRYDGIRWQPVALPQLTRAPVRALRADAAGGLWAGIDGLGLWHRDPRSGQWRQPDGASAEDEVSDLQPADAARLWVAGSAGVRLCDADRCTPLAAADGIAAYRVLPGRVKGVDVLWLGTVFDGVRRIDRPLSEAPERAAIHLGKSDGLPNDAVRALVTWGGRDDEDLWIGCGRGLARWDGERLVAYGAGNGFPTAMVFAFQPAVSQNGVPQLYATLRPGGLATFRTDGSWLLQGTTSGLPSNDTQALLISTVGSTRRTLWIGSIDAGIARRDPGQFIALDERFGLPDRNVYGIGQSRFPDGSRSIWIGTARGARRWHQGRWEDFVPPPYGDRTVKDVQLAGDGALWIATDRQALRVTGTGTVSEFNIDNSALPAVGVNQIAALGGANPTVWFGTGHGLARWSARDGLVRANLPGESDDRSQVTAMTSDDLGRVIWMSSDRGVSRIDGDGRIEPIAFPCIGKDLVRTLTLEQQPQRRLLWLGLADGVARADLSEPAACRRLSFRQDIGMVHGIAVDGRHRAWVFGSTVALRFPSSLADHDGVIDGDRYDRADGLAAAQLRSGANLLVDEQDHVYASTSLGLMAFEPESELPQTESARLDIVAASDIDGALLADGVALAAERNSLHFDYRLLSFEREQRIRYRARLAGPYSVGGDWQPQAQARYERLPPGSYTFELSARDADGLIYGPQQFRFSVRSPWWQSPWILAAAALLLIAAGVSAGRLRAYRSERRAAELARIVESRTADLEEAMARLERASLTDPLTGLSNRRAFAEQTRGEPDRILRRIEAGASHARALLVLADIDFFKRVNDSYGHAIGDRVLVEIARRLAGFQRRSDFVGRMGGEEFLLILRDLEPAEYAGLIERLLHEISDAPIEAGGLRLDITVSLGAVGFPDPAAGRDFESAMAAADDALYAIKQTGRNAAALVSAEGALSTAGQRRYRRIERSESAQ